MAYSNRSRSAAIPEIQRVTPLPDFKLKIELTSGSMLILNMADKRGMMRYCPLADPKIFESVTTDGFYLIFDTYPQFEVKIRSDEAIRLALDIPPLLEMRLKHERENQKTAL